jgi:alkylation response protein AidB-like acyl-CoA dehydrogenase
MQCKGDLVAYREQLRAWLDERRTRAPRRTVLAPLDEPGIVQRRAWQAELAGAGYLGVSWPARHGGSEGSPAQRVTVEQELEARGLAGGFDFVGLEMVGPTLVAHASAGQCDRYLRPLLFAEETWCQLLSEPGAGSDIAAIRTKARHQEDGSWLVEGQKVWTSFARHAAFGILLARTDPAAPRHQGLTMFVVPMDSEGLSIRPLRQITGDAEFNEVFLDGVRLAAGHRVGEVGDGWRVLLTMLGFERLAVGSGHLATSIERLTDVVAARPASRHDPRVRVRLGEIASELLALRHTSERLMEEIAEGQTPGPEAGFVKIMSVSASLAACRLAVDVAGPDALLSGEWAHQVSALPGVRSAGGTEEILRNQIGERVLGLPAEPRVG